MSASAPAVEVVFALPERQAVIEVPAKAGATVADVIEASGIAQRFPEVSIDSLDVGVWGRVVARSTVVQAGDRVEIYRPLELDPKEARRQLAAAGMTMRDARG